jgi:hypothetical protein
VNGGAGTPPQALRRVLMVAYHFPPLAGSSGIQRSLRFVQQLPALGWQPVVLTTQERAYERTTDDLLAEVPPGTEVHRAFAVDAARHLAVAGRYPGPLARPDRWMSWQFDAVRRGLSLIREQGIAAIWSTYPLATAHRIGATLQRRSGLPWIADFRDPMAQEGYPADPKVWQSFSDIEAAAMRQAARCCFTTPSAVATYRQRYPAAAERISLLENGYDEPAFANAQARRAPAGPLNSGCVTLLHSGIVYPAERDPTALFVALAALRQQAPDAARRLRVRFRAAVHEGLLHTLAAQHAVQSMVEICPPLGYVDALGEMLAADALLVMQASNCNEQVPAKTYEYLRAGRPIVCLSDPSGDTWGVLARAGLGRLARLDDSPEIVALLLRLLGDQLDGLMCDATRVAQASRAARSAVLAGWLDAAASGARTGA